MLSWKGRALGEYRRKPYGPVIVVGLLLYLAHAASAVGQGEEISPEERLRQAADLIAQEQYNQAIEDLAGIVRVNTEQLPDAEVEFRRIRTVNEGYIAKGEEVKEKLKELLSAEISQEELIPTAIEAFGLIAEMEDVLPNPNPRDAEIVQNLLYRVQLSIDLRRFRTLMDAAAVRLATNDYAGAAEIYVNGLDDIEGSGGTDAPQFSLENGLDIQRKFFEEREYGLFGDQIATTRESLRSIGEEFVLLAPDALSRAADLANAFSDGDFSDAQTKIDEYLDLLEVVTNSLLSVDVASIALAEAEALILQQTIDDEDRLYDWHIRFLRDIVRGREEIGEEEGLLATVASVREIVESAPVLAARTYGDERYSEAVVRLNEIAWPDEATGFRNLSGITLAIDENDARLRRASASYIMYTSILSTSRSLGITSPVPPEMVGDLDQSTIRSRWLDYSASVVDALGNLDSVSDPTLRNQIASASVLAASASSLRVIGQRSLDGLEVALDRRTTVSSLNNQRSGVQFLLGSLADPDPGTLREIVARREGLDAAIAEEPSIDAISEDSFRYSGEYAVSRISDLERFELRIVENVARIEYNGLSSRLLSLQTQTDGAERQLDGIEETIASVDDSGAAIRDATGGVVSLVATRRYPDRARRTLISLVGPTSGTRVLSTNSGDFQSTLDDAVAYAFRYERELPYIVSAQAIQQEIARSRTIATAIGEVTDPGLFGRGRDLLLRALGEIQSADNLEAKGDERVTEVRDLIGQARAANEAENLDLAAENLALAERLLKSDDQGFLDASDYFVDSLFTWYRPALEDRWNALQRDLNDQIALAQAEIVITSVQQAVREAQPLVEEERWAEALGILADADEVWFSVFPQTVYPPVVRLLRFVETALAKQNERSLREDDPDYDKLAPLLSRATQAVSEGLFGDASRFLDQFLRAQPNNLNARLLEVDIALASEEGDIATKVDRIIGSVLPEDVQRSEMETLEPTEALELQSLLIALLDRLSERADTSQPILSRISDEIGLLEFILSPPPIIVATPDLQAESNSLLDRALANGGLETLSATELASALGFIEQALNVDPTNQRAINQLSFALRLPNAPRRAALDATEQQAFREARNSFSRGDSVAALALIEKLWAVPDNRNDTGLNRFREELLDAIRRGR